MTRSHGVLRGLKRIDKSSVSERRFGRMFRWLPGENYDRNDLAKLASEMIQLESATLRKPAEAHRPAGELFKEGPDVLLNTPKPPELLDTAFGTSEPGDENPAIPAGYTYFGQFIDHDLTFDPNSSLQKLNDPDALEDFRTPRFDLDSLYGRGPDDQPYLYQNDRGIKFLLGREVVGIVPGAAKERAGDLPRNVEGRALVGDPRNDENDLICQLQCVFLNFHNKVVDTLLEARKDLKDHEIFGEAQRIVRWHYQYLVLNDYLPRVVGRGTWEKVLFSGKPSKPGDLPHPELDFYKPKSGQAYMPVEFSVAAFRFGHSMVRPSYALREGEPTVGGSPTSAFAGDPRFHRIPIFSDKRDGRTDNLSGFGPLPVKWEINWNLFFSKAIFPEHAFPTRLSKEGADKGVLEVFDSTTQPGYRVDTKLVDPLAMLPPSVAKSGNMPDGIPVLAYRNLIRGTEFELPSGQNVARALGVPVLSEAKLWGDSKNFATANPFAFRAPLWFYILKESEGVHLAGLENDKLGGHHLGAVGGRIVAEVLVGIALSDHTSYLYQDRHWTPDKEAAKSGFSPGAKLRSLYELIHWTTNGKMTFL